MEICTLLWTQMLQVTEVNIDLPNDEVVHEGYLTHEPNALHFEIFESE